MCASDQVAKQEARTYPPLPGIHNVPWSLDEVWAEAWTHQVLIRAYLLGIDSYVHAPELTTGECPEGCEYHPGDYEVGIAECTLHAPACPQVDLVCCECWIVRGPLGEPTELEQNPDCPLHWCPSWLAPCSCEYALHPVIWYPTHLIDVPGVGQRGAAYTIRIDRGCLHHGDAALIYPIGEPVDPRFWETLDELERGH